MNRELNHPQSWLYELYGIPESIELVSCLVWLAKAGDIPEANIGALFDVAKDHETAMLMLSNTQEKLPRKETGR